MKQIKEHYDSYLEYKCKSMYHKFFALVIYGLNYNDNELRFGINFDGKINNYQEIVFAKNDNDLYLKSDSTQFGRGRKLFLNCSSIINECYDKLMEFKGYESQFTYGIRPLNSSFFVDISKYGVSISNTEFSFLSEFKLDAHSYTDEYSYNSNSNSVLEVLRGNENNILNNIFVNICDCPMTWKPE